MQAHECLDATVAELRRQMGDELISVVLYGPAAHGEEYTSIPQLHLLIVLRDVDPATLRRLGPALRKWLRERQPWPRIFTPDILAQSVDVFPIEFSDIQRHHRVLHGANVLADLHVEGANLRAQCERELREKMMRLREAYVECEGRAKLLREVLVTSFASFAFILRGCLQLFGAPVPTRNLEVVTAFCERAGLSGACFAAVEALARGASGTADLEALFADYYETLTQIVDRVDRFGSEGERP